MRALWGRLATPGWCHLRRARLAPGVGAGSSRDRIGYGRGSRRPSELAGSGWGQGVLRGKRVAFLPPEAYGGHKDVNEAWVAGVLTVGNWPAGAGN